MFKVIVWTIILSFSFFLCKKSAGSMNPCKINMLSYGYYLIYLQTALGAIFVSFGFISHYTYGRLTNGALYSEIAIMYTVLLVILFPMISITLSKIFNFSPEIEYSNYLKKKTECKESNLYFITISIVSIICIIFLGVLINEIGYLPILKLFFADDNFNFAVERNKNVNMELWGSGYIKNIIVLFGIPVISCISFCFSLATREFKWHVLTSILIIASVVVKTYDFAKAPLILYFVVLFIAYVYYSGGVNPKLVAVLVSLGIAIMAFSYMAVGYSQSFFDIYNGMLGRTIFTQFGTFAMHLELFTEYYDLLDGKSLYPTMLKLLGMDPEAHIRSSRIVMEVYNPEGIYEGTAGVMNTIFIGEAFANWGTIGAVISIMWVSALLTLIFYAFIKLKKTPITVAYFALITQHLIGSIQGGFVDYIYNSMTLLIVMSGVGLYCLPYIINKFKYILSIR